MEEGAATYIEGKLVGILSIFGVEGTPECDVDIRSGDATGVAIQ